VVYEARQILLRHLNQNPVLTSWQAVLDYCALTIRGDVERFHVLYLDRRNRLISDECLAIGTIDHVPVYPREVLRRWSGEASAMGRSGACRMQDTTPASIR